MKRLIAVLLCVIASLLAVRVWQGIPIARGGPPMPVTQNGDVDGSGGININDAFFILKFLFQGGPDPVALADSPELLARVEALEAGAPPVQGFTFAGVNAQGFPEYTHNQTGIIFVRLPALAGDYEPVGFSCSPQTNTSMEDFLLSVLKSMSKATGRKFVYALGQAGQFKIGTISDLSNASYVSFHETEDLVGKRVRIGLPLFKRLNTISGRSLVQLVDLHSNAGQNPAAFSGILFENDRLVVWGSSEFHQRVERSLDRIRRSTEAGSPSSSP